MLAQQSSWEANKHWGGGGGGGGSARGGSHSWIIKGMQIKTIKHHFVVDQISTKTNNTSKDKAISDTLLVGM